jgi:hypothetical protein
MDHNARNWIAEKEIRGNRDRRIRHEISSEGCEKALSEQRRTCDLSG